MIQEVQTKTLNIEYLDGSLDKEPHTLRVKLRKFLENYIFAIVMTILTLFILFVGKTVVSPLC
jgi:hypothetical protein